MCVGRPVERIDDHGDRALGRVTPRLFAQHAHTPGEECRNGDGISCEVAAVLTRPCPGRAEVVERSERRRDRVGHVMQQGEPRRTGHFPTVAVALSGLAGLATVAAIDVPVFVADLKDHAVDHGFHVHDERHFVETYSLRQAWEVDLHPEEACGGPLDLHLALEVDPRTLLGFEDAVLDLPETDEPPDVWSFPLLFTWALPPLPKGPDLLLLATELAGVGGTDLPLEVSAIDSTASVTEATERSLSIVGRIEVSLAHIFLGQEQLCDVLDRCLEVSRFLLDRAPIWLDD